MHHGTATMKTKLSHKKKMIRSKPKISVVIPALNEEANLRERVPDIYGVLKEDVEVIIADGKSVDGTAALAKKFSLEYPNFIFFTQSGKGFANALLEGIARARGDVIVTMDAENHMPSEIPLLITALKETGSDIVVGSRFLAESNVDLQKERFISTRIGNRIAKAMLRLDVKDCSSGFRAYRAQTVKSVISGVRTQYFSIQVELLERIKYDAKGKLSEVGVHYMRRISGKSKFKVKPAIQDATRLIGLAQKDRVNEIKDKTRRIKERFRRKKKKQGT
ncbi:Glycosyltransferase AglD [uncultured archaeon]|nr:Glycosyltransferase AglD [uncultured archaeon]